MEKKPSEIEIAPFLHKTDTTAFHEFVQYFSALPKNSLVFIELSDKALEKSIRDLATLGYSNAQREGSRLPSFKMLLTAQTRNLKLIPIESMAFAESAKRFVLAHRDKGPTLEEIGKQLMTHVKREDRFAENIINQATTKGKVFVLVGPAHALNLEKMLQGRGYNVKVNTAIYSKENRAMVKQVMESGLKQREALLRGDLAAAAKHYSDIGRTSAQKLKIRKIQPGEGPIAFADKLKDRERKMAERRTRKAVRK